MRKKVFLALAALLLLLLAAGCIYGASLAAFPGRIREPAGAATAVAGGCATFGEGVIYRHPGAVPLLEVTGNHYEMGLQYGVLLRPEILEALQAYERIIRWNASEMGIPYLALMAVLKYKAKQMARDLPVRYLEETRGISDGSGVPQDTILAISLFYDLGEALGCTSVLLRGAEGKIIHGRNQDTSSFGGEELAKLTVVVRYNAAGYHAVTHTDWVLFMGVETAFNDQGLAFSEETLSISQPNPAGFPLVYLVRMVLEECASLDELAPFFDRYSTVGAYGTAWSYRVSGEGAIVEFTPTAWVKMPMEGTILWNFNHFYDAVLRQQQHPQSSLSGGNRDREVIASAFPLRQEYTIADCVKFLRSRIGPDGIDYSVTGSRCPISNCSGSQMVIFDPDGDGIYLALGTHFAACQDVYHVFADFSRPPELFMEAAPLDPIVEETARIVNRLISRPERLEALVVLAERFPSDAYAQFGVAHNAFLLSKMDLFSAYAGRAHALDPMVGEYIFYAGLGVYRQGKWEEAAALLETVDPADLQPWQEAGRLLILERCSVSDGETAQASAYETQRQRFLEQYGAKDCFTGAYLKRFDALSKK